MNRLDYLNGPSGGNPSPPEDVERPLDKRRRLFIFQPAFDEYRPIATIRITLEKGCYMLLLRILKSNSASG